MTIHHTQAVLRRRDAWDRVLQRRSIALYGFFSVAWRGSSPKLC